MYSKYVDAGGVAVSYLHSGPSTLPDVTPAFDRGELLLFVHGAGGNAGSWRKVAALLAEQHSVAALDLPGHGRSGGVDGLASVDEYADLVASVVERLALRPLVIVGKGMGASIALRYGMKRRDVRGLVLIGAAGRVEILEASLDAWRAVTQGRAPQPFSDEEFAPGTPFDVKREAWAEQVKTDPRVRYGDLLAWRAADLCERLHEVRQPVLVVSGADDRVVPAQLSQELCPLLPNARMEVIDNAGHAVELEQSDALASRIRAFVGSIDLQEKA